MDVEAAVAQAFREEWGQVVASLIRVTGDWDLAEECAQEAFTLALRTWPRDGIPRRPGAWLTTAARNRATDRIRRETLGATKLREAGRMHIPDDAHELDESGVEDDRLRLIFTCCHPALAVEAQVALALRTLAGLSTAEIARAFLVPEATMSQRLVRVKRKIRNAGIPYRVPPAHLLPERTSAVLGVLYLTFNEGYSASAGPDLLRPDVAAEAVRLARVLAQLMPDEPEVLGLLSLMLLQHARRATRVGAGGQLVPLEEQDRARWDSAEITEGTTLLETALRRRRPGPYQIQAAIAACHATATRAADTDWAQISGLYRELRRFVPTPVVALNQAVAVGMADGPLAGLAQVDQLAADGQLDGYHLLPATRADFLRRLGRHEEAVEAYTAALALTTTEAERSYLGRRIAEIEAAEVSVRADPVRRVDDRPRPSGRTSMTAHTLAVPGARLHYEVSGTGPVLLLIPGGPADSGAFTGIRPLLDEHYTVVTYDPRGISRSPLDGPPPEQGLIREHADDVQRLLAEVTTEPAYVFATSGGAITAMDHLVRHPEQVRAVVLHEPPVTRYLDARVLDGPDIPELYREQGLGPALGAFMATAGLEPPPEQAGEATDQSAMLGNFAYFFGHLLSAIGEFTPDVEALKTVPTRVIVGVGEKSGGTPAHDAGLGLAADLGRPAQLFPGDHGGCMGEPAEFAVRLREILEEN